MISLEFLVALIQNEDSLWNPSKRILIFIFDWNLRKNLKMFLIISIYIQVFRLSHLDVCSGEDEVRNNQQSTRRVISSDDFSQMTFYAF
uniref:Uncharacterized protein n=1 Tax=Caenorhabditis tropicalis TaxID=1561998 RepID=A0A1I7UEH1_9PELO